MLGNGSRVFVRCHQQLRSSTEFANYTGVTEVISNWQWRSVCPALLFVGSVNWAMFALKLKQALGIYKVIQFGRLRALPPALSHHHNDKDLPSSCSLHSSSKEPIFHLEHLKLPTPSKWPATESLSPSCGFATIATAMSPSLWPRPRNASTVHTRPVPTARHGFSRPGIGVINRHSAP